MTSDSQWLTWAHRIQEIAQTGLTYGKDIFDIERYRDLQTIASEIIAARTANEPDKVENLLSLESGYPTPKVDVRVVVFDNLGQLLFARETSDGKWSLPGGWADIDESAGEVAVRETYEETGYQVRPIKLLGLMDRNKHPHPRMFWHVYKVFIRCELTGGSAKTSIETDSVGFFDRNNIPDLSVARVTGAQINRIFEHYDNPLLPADFD